MRSLVPILLLSSTTLLGCATAGRGTCAPSAAPASRATSMDAPGDASSTVTATPALSAAATPPQEVRSFADAPKRQVGQGKARIALLAQGQNAFLGQLELAPGAAVPEHQDATEEFIHVLSGGGTLTMNGETYEVGPGSTIYMPAGATVSFQNGDAPMRGIQVFAGPQPAAKYDSWQPIP